MAGIKIKSKSAAKKRFRVTGSGKIKRAHGHLSHLNSHKPSKRTRRLRKMAIVDKTDQKRVERMLVI